MINETQPNLPPTQPLSPTPTHIPSQPSTSWSKIQLFIVSGLIIVVVSVFIGFQISKTQTPSQQPIVVQPAASPTQAIVNTAEQPTENQTMDSAANWKTYSRIANLTFQFPNDWSEQPNYSLQSSDKLMSIWLEGGQVGLECQTLIRTENVTINNTELVLNYYDGMKSENCDTQGNKVIFFLFTVDSKKYSFTFDYKDSNKEDSEKLFTQILSTFKFAN